MRSALFCLCFFRSLFFLAQDHLRTVSDSIAYIKLRKGIVTFKRNIPPEDVRVYISVKMRNEKDGNYKIIYHPGTANMYELKRSKWVTPGAAIGEAIGGLVVLTLTILSVSSHLK